MGSLNFIVYQFSPETASNNIFSEQNALYVVFTKALQVDVRNLSPHGRLNWPGSISFKVISFLLKFLWSSVTCFSFISPLGDRLEHLGRTASAQLELC